MNPVISDEERLARAVLSYVTEPGDPLTGAVTRSAGAVQALKVIRSGRLAGVTWPVGPAERRRALERLRARLGEAPRREEILRALDSGSRFRLVCPGDLEWPGGLDALGDTAPVALWVTGVTDLSFACRRSAAVTGARAATAYGSYLASEFSASLGERGCTVIAGGSFGVDAAAHRGALGAGGVTLAVLACGLDVPYPAAHAELFSAVAAQGALVSEWPPGVRVSRLRFQSRNRLIAALASGTVIVEAATRSGSLALARCARDLGRPVMAVPGPVTSELSAGCNDLIRSGRAVLVTSPDDVADTLAAADCPAG